MADAIGEILGIPSTLLVSNPADRAAGPGGADADRGQTPAATDLILVRVPHGSFEMGSRDNYFGNEGRCTA